MILTLVLKSEGDLREHCLLRFKMLDSHHLAMNFIHVPISKCVEEKAKGKRTSGYKKRLGTFLLFAGTKATHRRMIRTMVWGVFV